MKNTKESDNTNENPQGSLTVVGTGISISGQMTLYTESVIKNADIVLAVVTDSAFANLQKLNTYIVNPSHEAIFEANSRLQCADAAADTDIEATLKIGMDAYGAKPIDSDTLYAEMNEILCDDDKVALKTTLTDNLDENMGPELFKLTQIDKARAVAQLHGRVNLYDGLVQDFIGMQDHIGQLETALAQNDVKQIKLIVHTYKSGLAYIGAYALSTLGKQLDASISADEDSLSPDLVSRVKLYINAISQVTEALKSQGQ